MKSKTEHLLGIMQLMVMAMQELERGDRKFTGTRVEQVTKLTYQYAGSLPIERKDIRAMAEWFVPEFDNQVVEHDSREE